MENENIKPRAIAFDFSGVITKYKGFIEKDYQYEPNMEVVQAIRALKEKGYKILIHSTEGEDYLKKYCESYAIPYDWINRRTDKESDNPDKPMVSVYVDDRAICYKGQETAELLEEIIHFQPYWKKN